MKTVSKSASKLALAAALFTVGARADSLWTSSGTAPRSMVADRKAASKGDILTIVVAESAVAQSSQSKKSSRESSLDDSVTKFIYPGLGTHGGALPGLTIGGKASNTGG